MIARNVTLFVWFVLAVTVAFVGIQQTNESLVGITLGSMALCGATFVRIPTSSGNRLSFAIGVATAVPLLIGTVYDAPGALATVAVGFLCASATQVFVSEKADREGAAHDLMRRSIGALVFVLVYIGMKSVIVLGVADDQLASLLAVVVAALIWFGVDVGSWAMSTYGVEHLSRRYLLRLSAQDWPVVFSAFAVGALFAFALPKLGWWAPIVALLPYSFAHFGFHRSHTARVTYRQTIRSLARIPEVAGLSPDGHSDRTADLAVAVAKELGLTPDDVENVEYAARMHDIGRITLNEPNIIKVGFTDQDIANWGAEIISEAPYLQHVADLVRQQHNPYRRPGERKDPDLPTESKIIRAASAYDHATHELGFSSLEALEVLHRGAAYDFDPEVVEGIRHVVTSV